MPDPDRRRRMISLRLSEVEYEVLKTQYRAYGARNVSELARLAIQQVINVPAGTDHEVTVRLHEFDARLHALEALVPFLLPQRAKESV